MSTIASSPTLMAKLTERHEVAANTMAFHFEKPVGWAFKAGQFLEIVLSISGDHKFFENRMPLIAPFNRTFPVEDPIIVPRPKRLDVWQNADRTWKDT